MSSRNIKAKALQIKTETQARANNANRVGGLFEDIADELTDLAEFTTNSVAAEAARAAGKEQELETTSTGLRSDLGAYEDNAEFLRVLTDSEGHFLCGFKKDGDVVFGVGVPSEVKKAIQNNSSEIIAELDGKVDKVSGKQLSTEDFTSALKNKLTSIPNSVPSTDDLSQGLSEKVDKEEGKGLISNNYLADSANKEYAYIICDEHGTLLFGILQNGKVRCNIEGEEERVNSLIHASEKSAEADKNASPQFFDTLTLMQNYYDDQLQEKHGQMLRTDTIVWNQANIGMASSGLNSEKGLKFIGDDTTTVQYRYFYWLDVQTIDGSYDFSPIGTFITGRYNQHQRCILGIFPSTICNGNNYNTYIKDGVELRYTFPEYVLNLMLADPSHKESVWEHSGIKWLLLDIECDAVYTEYTKLLSAFGTWLYATSVDTDITMRDCLLYIDFRLKGGWGEGWMHGLTDLNPDKVVRYTEYFLQVCPDIQINVGRPYSAIGDSGEIAAFITEKELSNTAGYTGVFIDDFGTYDTKWYGERPCYNGRTWAWYFEKYRDRGDFMTGEFSMFVSVGNNTNKRGITWEFFNFVKRYRLPYVRVSNITVYMSDIGAKLIRYTCPTNYYAINNALAITGFRYVITRIGSAGDSTELKLVWEITNIGVNKCFFDIYNLYYRIYDIDTGTFTERSINVDICRIMPSEYAEPCRYFIGQGVVIEDTFTNLPSNYSINVIGKDKKGIGNPIYFSNYDRQTDGSYILKTNN